MNEIRALCQSESYDLWGVLQSQPDLHGGLFLFRKIAELGLDSIERRLPSGNGTSPYQRDLLRSELLAEQLVDYPTISQDSVQIFSRFRQAALSFLGAAINCLAFDTLEQFDMSEEAIKQARISGKEALRPRAPADPTRHTL